MPKVICPIHGGNIAPHVCPHVVKSVLANVPLGNLTFVDLDGFFFMGWLCDHCMTVDGLKSFLADQQLGILSEDQKEEQIDRLIELIDFQPVCPKCFEELRS
jgi:hypothetical protein